MALFLFFIFILTFLIKPSLFYSVLLFAAVLGIPGYLLSLILLNNKKVDFFSSISILASFGIIPFIIPMLTAYLFKLSWFYFSIFLLTEILVLFVWIVSKKIYFTPKFIMPPDRYDLVAIVISVITSIAMLLHGGHFIGDAMFHLASIMKLANNAIIDPYAPMFKGTTQITFNYAYNIWYGIIALVAKIGPVSLRKLWDVSPAIFTFYIFSSVYFFTNRLFKDKKAALLSLIVFFVYDWLAYGFIDFKYLPYPDQIARNGLLLIAFGIMVDEASSKREVLIKSVTTTLLLTSIILIHMYSFAAFFIILTCYYVLVLVFYSNKFYQKQLLTILLTALLANLPFLYIRLWFSNYSISNLIVPSASVKYVKFLDSISLSNNFYVLFALITVGIAIFFLTKLIVKKNNNYSKLLLFLLACVTTYTLMNTEKINIIVGHFISYTYSKRLADYSLYPYLFCSAFIYFLFLIWCNQRVFVSIKKLVVWVGSGCIFIFLFIAFFYLYQNYTKNNLYNRSYVLRENNVYTYVEKNIPKWQVFASYGYPSLEIASQVPQYIISGMNTHLPPTEDVSLRNTALLRLFSFNLSVMEYINILDRYDCDYLLLALKIKPYTVSLLGGKETFSINHADKFINMLPSVFNEIYKDDTYVLYKIRRKF